MQKSPKVRLGGHDFPSGDLAKEAAWLSERARRSSNALAVQSTNGDLYSQTNGSKRRRETPVSPSMPALKSPSSFRDRERVFTDEYQEQEKQNLYDFASSSKEQRLADSSGTPLSFVQLQMLAFIVVFSASGIVPVVDMLFALFATVYIGVLSLLVFPARRREKQMNLFEGSKAFGVYNVLGSALGLFLPLAYVLGGFARSDQRAVLVATPHLFLLACQTLSENIIQDWPTVSFPVRALLSTLYNARRLFTIASWIVSIQSASSVKASLITGGGEVVEAVSSYWPFFGRFLAFGNAVYWSFNLFGLLVPVILPLAFRKYVEEESKEEVPAPMLQSKQNGLDKKFQSARYPSEGIDRLLSPKSM